MNAIDERIAYAEKEFTFFHVNLH